MTINIITAAKNIISDKYNKNNMKVYIIFASIIYFLGYILPDQKELKTLGETLPINEIGFMLPLLLIGFFVYLYLIVNLNGMNVMATHNLAHRIKGVFPNFAKEKKQIWKTGCDLVGGVIIWEIIIIIPLAILYALCFAVKPLIVVAAIITLLVVIGLLLYSPLMYLSFCLTKKMSDLFNFAKATKILTKSKGRFFLLYLLGICIFVCLFLIIFILSLIFSPLVLLGKATTIIAMIITALITTAISLYSQLLWIDLCGQFLREITPKPKKQEEQIQ